MRLPKRKRWNGKTVTLLTSMRSYKNAGCDDKAFFSQIRAEVKISQTENESQMRDIFISTHQIKYSEEKIFFKATVKNCYSASDDKIATSSNAGHKMLNWKLAEEKSNLFCTLHARLLVICWQQSLKRQLCQSNKFDLLPSLRQKSNGYSCAHRFSTKWKSFFSIFFSFGTCSGKILSEIKAIKRHYLLRRYIPVENKVIQKMR